MMENYTITGVILIQFIIGFTGSLLASYLIAKMSEGRLNRVISGSEKNIIASLTPINNNTSIIADEIKTLAQVVDKMREALEKTK